MRLRPGQSRDDSAPPEPGWYIIVPESGASMPKVALVTELNGRLVVQTEQLGLRDLDARGLYEGWRWGPKIPL